MDHIYIYMTKNNLNFFCAINVVGDSFLVRLMDSIDLYQKADGEYNSDVITKLTYNYRSHPQILKVPNNLFYDGELVVRFTLPL